VAGTSTELVVISPIKDDLQLVRWTGELLIMDTRPVCLLCANLTSSFLPSGEAALTRRARRAAACHGGCALQPARGR